MKAPRKGTAIPRTVLVEAERAVLRERAQAPKPAPTTTPSSKPGARAKAKVVAALRRLHPMD